MKYYGEIEILSGADNILYSPTIATRALLMIYGARNRVFAECQAATHMPRLATAYGGTVNLLENQHRSSVQERAAGDILTVGLAKTQIPVRQ